VPLKHQKFENILKRVPAASRVGCEQPKELRQVTAALVRERQRLATVADQERRRQA